MAGLRGASVATRQAQHIYILLYRKPQALSPNYFPSPIKPFYLFVGGLLLLIFALVVLRLRESRAIRKHFKQAEEVENRTLASLDRTEAAHEQTRNGYETQQKSHDLLVEQNRLLQEILDTLKRPKQ